MIRFVEVSPTDERFDDVVPVLQELRTRVPPDELRSRYEAAHATGFRIVALFDGDVCRAVAGYRILTNLGLGRYVYVDDLVTSESARSSGYGKMLLDHVNEVAARAGCVSIRLDSGVQRFDAHRFYLRERFVIAAHHFARRIAGGMGE